MKYFVCETINGDPTAGLKARNDIAAIFNDIGWTPILLNFVFNEKMDALNGRSMLKKVSDNLQLSAEWGRALKPVGAGDVVLIQFPVLRRPVALSRIIKTAQRRGAKVIFLIHDLELLRYNKRHDVGLLKKTRIMLQERSIIKRADEIIVHNDKMMMTLKESGIVDCQMISLGIFDYLVPNYKEKERNFSKTVAIAGNLRQHKCKYLQYLPKNVQFNLYGVGYESQGMDNVKYFGSFRPNDLPDRIEASFGLVWDGDSADSCTGVTGEYLRINNPHKTSLYLAAGIPVIIWSKAALADFVTENECGIVVDSLSEIEIRLNLMNDIDYQRMHYNALTISEKLRIGYYTKAALSKCISLKE